MKILPVIIAGLFSFIVLSPYYDKDSKYAPEDSYMPKSQLNVEAAKDRIETYLNTNKEPLRKRPKYERIE
ncbi:MAG: hypothetical protein FWE18_06035 [Alphaproteobacteria bacterium]|nr:hypothetical protein [Alphaproteobacteria bacterium]